MSVTLENLDLHTPKLIFDRGYPFEAWDLLRKEAPVFWYDRPEVEPFWAVTKHEDIQTVSPETEVRVHDVPFRDPWDFEEVYGQTCSSMAGRGCA